MTQPWRWAMARFLALAYVGANDITLPAENVGMLGTPHARPQLRFAVGEHEVACRLSSAVCFFFVCVYLPIAVAWLSRMPCNSVSVGWLVRYSSQSKNGFTSALGRSISAYWSLPQFEVMSRSNSLAGLS